MVVHLVNVHGADPVVRRDEARLGILREVAAIPKPEAAQLDDHGHAVGVVGGVLGNPLDLVGERIARSSLGHRHELLHRRHAANADLGLALDLFEREFGARFDDVAPADSHISVRLDAEQKAGVGPAVRVAFRDAVVPHVFDRHFLRQLGRATEVVDVEMRDDEVVDLLYAGDLGGGFVQPPRVAAARHAGVDEDRLASGGDDQRAAAALDVHPVNIECLGILGGCRADDGQRQHR